MDTVKDLRKAENDLQLGTHLHAVRQLTNIGALLELRQAKAVDQCSQEHNARNYSDRRVQGCLVMIIMTPDLVVPAFLCA